MYKNRRNYGDSSVILNSLELLTENPATLVVGGSEILTIISVPWNGNSLTVDRKRSAALPMNSIS